jgi:hypothetical protein
VRDWTGKLPDSPTKEQATKDLLQAEEALQLAKVEVARSLGYDLCKNHFPPGIMITLPHDDPTLMEFQRKCDTCGDIRPKNPAKRPRPQANYF